MSRDRLLIGLTSGCLFFSTCMVWAEESTQTDEATAAEPAEANASDRVVEPAPDPDPIEQEHGDPDAFSTVTPVAKPDPLPQLEEYVSPLDPVTEYLNAIDRAEILNGAYSPDMADLYQGLGKALLDRREFEEAKEAFQQGMQIVRVNEGLNSPRQTEYLFSIADIEAEVGSRRSTDEILDLIYQLNVRHHGEYGIGMLPVLQQLVSWYGRMRPFDTPESRYPDMYLTGQLVGRMAEITEQNFGLGAPETAEYYRKMAQINWMSARYALGRGISVEPGYIVSVGAPSQNPNTQGISIKTLVSDGERAFEKVVESVVAREDSTV
ncbi:MAG: tetratricopeptide repeat protein, partial [Xanthomonadales bacterium]|nr:tetratricopeptide repeat protein [Xanthomonadales bacterium]